MILYYAMGGGLGHLVRARAVLHTLGLETRAALLTASAYARDTRVVGELAVEVAPAGGAGDLPGHRRWLGEALRRHEPAEIFVDTFPVGLLGELAELSLKTNARLTFVARLLQWPAYVRAFPEVARVRFERSYVVEPLHADHEAAVGAASDEVVALELRDPPDHQTRASMMRALPSRFWLVVHSGPPEEIAELVAYARELQRIEGDRAPIVVTSRHAAPAGEDLIALDLFPATPLFARAVRIVSACGYNVMRQTAPYCERHRFLPFPRRYDDQFARAAHRRLSTPAR